MDGFKDATDNGTAEGAEFFDTTSLLEAATESNGSHAADSTVAVSATLESEDEDDPLTLFSWTLKHRATSTFARGPYEARLIVGSDCLIQSGESADELMTWMRDKSAEIKKKLES